MLRGVNVARCDRFHTGLRGQFWLDCFATQLCVCVVRVATCFALCEQLDS